MRPKTQIQVISQLINKDKNLKNRKVFLKIQKLCLSNLICKTNKIQEVNHSNKKEKSI